MGKILFLERVSSYFIRMVIAFTTFLSLLFLSSYYERLELWIIDMLFLVALIVLGIVKFIRAKS